MKTRSEAGNILRKLEQQHPNADTELEFGNAFELLVATILSAQTTDAGVNAVTPRLFARYPDARALGAADPSEVERLIKPTGFFRQKTRSILGMSQALVETHGGDVPPAMESLVRLPGVGRKTANVVLAHALGIPGLPVDRHVLRVANRIGLADSEEPEVVEQQLGALYPPDAWRVVSDTLILHGRRICNPRPLCDRCAVRGECDAYRSGAVSPRPRTGEAAGPPTARTERPRMTRARSRASVAEPRPKTRKDAGAVGRKKTGPPTVTTSPPARTKARGRATRPGPRKR